MLNTGVRKLPVTGTMNAGINQTMKRIPLPVLLILLGAVLLLLALATVIWQGVGIADIATLPRLAGLAHTRLVTGAAAGGEIQGLHGTNFAFRNAVVVEYDGGRVSLWVAELANASQAAQMLQDMQARIAQGGSPFIPLGEQVIRGSGLSNGRTLYALEGMGQGHVYFQSGARLVWLAADADVLEAAVDECLAFFP